MGGISSVVTSSVRAGVAPSGVAPDPYLTIGNNCITPEQENAPTDSENERSEWVSSTRKKKATVLRLEVNDMIQRHGVDAVVTFNLTFSEFLRRKECERRFHSFQTNVLRKIAQEGMQVFERSSKGRPHYHGALVLKGAPDVRTGFDFDSYDLWAKLKSERSRGNLGQLKALSASYAKNATPALRSLWKTLSPKRMKAYGFGMAHVVPVRKNGEAFAVYMAKYLSKNPEGKAKDFAEDDKGHRSYRIWGKKRVANIHHSPNTKNSWKWRRRVEFTAKVLGEITRGRPYTHDEFTFYLGPRWCFHLKPWIIGLPMSYIKNREWGTHSEMKRYGELGMPEMKKGANHEQWLIDEYLRFFE